MKKDVSIIFTKNHHSANRIDRIWVEVRNITMLKGCIEKYNTIQYNNGPERIVEKESKVSPTTCVYGKRFLWVNFSMYLVAQLHYGNLTYPIKHTEMVSVLNQFEIKESTRKTRDVNQISLK